MEEVIRSSKHWVVRKGELFSKAWGVHGWGQYILAGILT